MKRSDRKFCWAILFVFAFVVSSRSESDRSPPVQLIFEVVESISDSAALALGFQPDDEQVAIGKVVKVLAEPEEARTPDGLERVDGKEVSLKPFNPELMVGDVFIVALWFPYELEIEEHEVKAEAREWSFEAGSRYFGVLTKVELTGSGGRRRVYYLMHDSKHSLVPVSRNTDPSSIRSYAEAVLAYERQQNANSRLTSSIVEALKKTNR